MQTCGLRMSGVILLLIALAPAQTVLAQDECRGMCKLNSNVAMMLNMPVNQTGEVMGTGWGAGGGVGYNISQRNSLIGEFLWNRMYPSKGVLQPFQTAVPQSGTLNGNSNLYGLTGNYRYELRGRLLGTYVIGGGGWYFRKNWLSKDVNSGAGTACTPAWLWWGFTCMSGTVTANQTLATTSTNAWGMNGGIGFTVRVGEAPYRLYTEARYHYVPTKNVSTQFVAVSFGIRF